MAEARKRGMVFPMPIYETIELDELEQRMEHMSRTKIQFLFYIDNHFIKSHRKPFLILQKNVLSLIQFFQTN